MEVKVGEGGLLIQGYKSYMNNRKGRGGRVGAKDRENESSEDGQLHQKWATLVT